VIGTFQCLRLGEDRTYRLRVTRDPNDVTELAREQTDPAGRPKRHPTNRVILLSDDELIWVTSVLTKAVQKRLSEVPMPAWEADRERRRERERMRRESAG
jgi:hypothetical protein